MSQATQSEFVSALLVGATPQSRLIVLDVFRQAGWRLYEARNRKGALGCLERHPVQVVVTNAHFLGWPWKRALQDLRRMPAPPQLVVTSHLADDSLWAEVLNWGGYDVLAEPFERSEVERVIASARRHFNPPLARAGLAHVAAAS